MFDISEIKVEKQNPMEIFTCLVFEHQKDWTKDSSYTEYTFRYLETDGFTKEDLTLLQRKFNPHHLHVYLIDERKVGDLLLIGFVYRKDSLPEFMKFVQQPIELGIARKSDYEIVYSDNPKYVFPDDQKKKLK